MKTELIHLEALLFASKSDLFCTVKNNIENANIASLSHNQIVNWNCFCIQYL